MKLSKNQKLTSDRMLQKRNNVELLIHKIKFSKLSRRQIQSSKLSKILKSIHAHIYEGTVKRELDFPN